MAVLIQDIFSQRLVSCFAELVEANIINRKKIYSGIIKIAIAYFNQIERGERNYPKDETKRSEAVENLNKEWGINPDYINGISTKVFLKKPKNLQHNSALKITSHSQLGVTNKYAEQLNYYKTKCESLEAENADLKRRLNLYV